MCNFPNKDVQIYSYHERKISNGSSKAMWCAMAGAGGGGGDGSGRVTVHSLRAVGRGRPVRGGAVRGAGAGTWRRASAGRRSGSATFIHPAPVFSSSRHVPTHQSVKGHPRACQYYSLSLQIPNDNFDFTLLRNITFCVTP